VSWLPVAAVKEQEEASEPKHTNAFSPILCLPCTFIKCNLRAKVQTKTLTAVSPPK